MNRLRVGILGGTFDPVHIGHLHIARAVRRRFRLDEIWFLIARTPPHKRTATISPEWHRCSMVAIAIRNEPSFKICDYELRSGSSYTINTLRALRGYYRSRIRFYFIAGGDALRDFSQWHEFESLLEEFHIIFVRRAEIPDDGMPATLDPRVAARVRPYRRGDAPWNRGSFLVDVGAPPVSSTDIRELGSAAKIRKWVSSEVYRYIVRHSLYEKR